MMYSIDFPAGSMGLELEPVIISTERQIGCKIKDFYFALDHNGIKPDELKSKVSIGDIICYIGEKNVLSAKFTEILDILRLLKSERRSIIFKSLPSECKSFHCTNHSLFSP